MTVLVLLNGPPASGKSTLAARYVDTRPLALNLDVDVIRGQLGRWLDLPRDAGRAARRLCLVMAEAHLRAGHDVIVPQFLGRPDFIGQLEAAAAGVGARFVEIALMTSREEAIRWFAERSGQPETQQHVDAAALVARSSADIGAMYDAFRQTIQSRPKVAVVPVIRSDIERTFRDVLAAVEAQT